MNNSFKRYLALVDETPEDAFNKPVWCPAEKPPDTPYLEIEINIVKHEQKYSGNRGE